MFNTELTYLLEAAVKEAMNRHHAYLCIEHILYALIADSDVTDILQSAGCSVPALRQDLEYFLDNEVEKKLENTVQDPVQTSAMRRVIQRSLIQVKSSGREVVIPRDILVSIINEEDSHASFFIRKQGVDKIHVLEYISHGVKRYPELDVNDGVSANHDSEDGSPEKKLSSEEILNQFTEELTAIAKKGGLDPVVGREKEIDRAIRVLARRQKNNPLFIGEPGVGKTSLAHGIAQRIVDGEVPDQLKDANLYSLHVGSLVAGTKFRGEFEERLRRIVKALENKTNALLFIDEIHQLVGAGATGSGSMDAANLLKPALQSGKLRCIGSTTYEDFKKSLEKDRALLRRFSTIDVREPTVEETEEILKGLIKRYENFHNVKYTSAAIHAAATLSAKCITGRLLPDKAIDVVDEAGASNSVLPLNKRKKTITEKEIEIVVSLIARIPVQSVSKDDEDVLRNLFEKLRKKVFGQDEAISIIVKAVKRSRASLGQDQKPIGSFLFAGPTGVGKTELSKALADELGVAFHRFDMSEYMEKHTVARLVGAPPGYVGYEEGGQLTDLVRKQPYAVLLLDEIEKAHEDIYNILLQVMDDARLTDSQGKHADFRNIILIMTTNAGSEKSALVGFGSEQQVSHQDAAVKKLFKPEFRNRLDEIVFFKPLRKEILSSIVEKNIKLLEKQLSERKVTFNVTDQAKEYLAQKGFDPFLGARPMARLIQKEIKDALTDELLFGELKKGGHVNISILDGKLNFKIEKK